MVKRKVKSIWKRKAPVRKTKAKPLTAKQKTAAKARAKRAGRKYPNLVDNLYIKKRAKRK